MSGRQAIDCGTGKNLGASPDLRGELRKVDENFAEIFVRVEALEVAGPGEGDGGVTLGEVIAALYPVGALKFSADNVNPGQYLPGTTWIAWGVGRVLVGFSAGDSDFDAAEKIGGAKTVSLTEAQIPAHTHLQDAHGHTQDAHTHVQNSHTHLQDAHTHVQNSHTHLQDAHTHVQNSHNHTQDAHAHTLPVGPTDDTAAAFDRADAGTNASGANATTSVGSTTATNQVATAVNQNATPTNQVATAVNQNGTATNQVTTAVNQNATATNQSATATNQSTGGGGAHPNVQPYITGFMWKRTA